MAVGTLIGDENKFSLESDGDDYGLKVSLAKGESVMFPAGDRIKAIWASGGKLNVVRPYANDITRTQSSNNQQVSSAVGTRVANPFTAGEALVEQVDSLGETILGTGDYATQGFIRITNRSNEVLNLMNILASLQSSKNEEDGEVNQEKADNEVLRVDSIPTGTVKLPIQQILGTTPQFAPTEVLNTKFLIWLE